MHAPGHCNFTASETVAVILTMVERLNVGHWAGTATPEALDALRIVAERGSVDLRPVPPGQAAEAVALARATAAPL